MRIRIKKLPQQHELNAKKWKHSLGGNLFSGEDTPTQQMNNGLNLYRRTNNLGETEYIYQETPDSEEILLTPTNKRFSDDPTNWDYKDASGRKYSPRMVSPSSSSTLETSEKMGPLEKYVAELNWRAKNDPASIALQGKYTMPAIAAPLLAPLGEAFAGTTIAGVPATTWANTAMAAGFAGHGLNHAINEGINGWGDAAMTALEITPLGQLAKPLYEGAGMLASKGIDYSINNVYHPWVLSRNMTKGLKNNPIIKTYDSSPRYLDAGSLLDYQDYINSMFPGSSVKGVVSHTTSAVPFEAFDPAKIKRGFGFYFSPTEHSLPFNRNVYARVNIQNPLEINTTTNRSLSVDGLGRDIEGTWRTLKNGNHDGIIGVTNMRNPGEPEIVALSPEQIHILGSNKDIEGFRKFMPSPQITAENAVSMTPEQWTAAQDAAIARGDMTEAQRLRDLHFQVSAPNTVASVNGQPLQLYHGTDATFNAFDVSKYGNTDGGTFGRGIYTTPVKTYAELYGENNMPLYMKLDNPRDYRNSSIGDLMAEKFVFGDDFATGNGIDGVIGRPSWKGFKGLEEYVSHNPKNIKSSLPITYDDNGVRIPLGERDNFNINDIRYGLLPFGIGLTGYGLSQGNE